MTNGKKPWWSPFLSKPYAAAVLIVGISLSGAIYGELRALEEDRFESGFRSKTGNLTASIQNGVNERLAALESVWIWINAEMRGGLYNKMASFRAEFDVISGHMVSRYGSVRMIGFLPLIKGVSVHAFEKAARKNGGAGFTIRQKEKDGSVKPANGANDYYPLYLVTPAGPDKNLEGLDFSSDPVFKGAMDMCRARRGPYSTGPVKLPGGGDNAKYIFVFWPLDKNWASGAAVGKEDPPFGFAMAVFDAGKLVTSSLSSIDMEGIHVHLYDMHDTTIPIADRFIMDAGKPDNYLEEHPADIHGDVFGKYNIARGMNVAGRPWSAVFMPAAEYLQLEKSSHAAMAFWSGVAVTLALTWQLAGLVRRNEMVERLVAQRTAEIVHLNRLSSLGEMSAGVAHEMNQPFTGIMNYAEIAREYLDMDPPQMDKVRESLAKIAGQVRRGKEFIKDLKTFAGSGDSSVTKVDVNHLIERTLDMLSPTMKKNGVTVTTELSSGLACVPGSQLRLEQSLVNVINNAMEASEGKDERRIRVTTHRLGDGHILVSVEDNGAGFAPEVAEKIFDPFFTTKSKKEGCGLGLAISRRIIHDHGGEITARSIPGGGAVFSIMLKSDEHGHA
ncbi:MAG: CHASE domain-containing protein [Nitrospinae bacterium]|nr:CHASE domain-containing protein [Nitrospinota bacterium]